MLCAAIKIVCRLILLHTWCADLFSKLTFSQKKKSGIHVAIRVSKVLGQDKGRQNQDQDRQKLIWVQTVCKGYQQTTKVYMH